MRPSWPPFGGDLVEGVGAARGQGIGCGWLAVIAQRTLGVAARFVPLDQLALSPQCGFSSTVHGNELTEDDQWRKLARVIEVANQVWPP